MSLWDWVPAVASGVILGVAVRFFWGLARRLTRRPPQEEEEKLLRKVYLEPQRAKEILRDLERKKETTLSEIDAGYAARRRDFLAYLEGQREQIIRELHERQARSADQHPRPPPEDPEKGAGSP